MKVAPGDVVHVRGTVTKNMPDGVVWMEFGRAINSHITNILIAESDIVHVERAPLKVGDDVYIPGSSWRYKILAIDGNIAWIKHMTRYITRGLNELERA